MRRRILGVGWSIPVCILLLGLSAGCAERSENLYNVVVISVDTLRPDHLGCYGYGRDTSPVIDSIASRGTMFRHAVSSSAWTLPAHMSLFTSLPESVHRVNTNWVRLDPERVTLAESLRQAGYSTAGFYTGPYLHQSFGFDQGFDVYEGCMDYQDRFSEVLKGAGNNDEYAEAFEVLRDGEGESSAGDLALLREIDLLSHADRTSSDLASRAIEWLEESKDSKFFLFLHFFDAHYDFVPPPPYDAMFRDPSSTSRISPHGFISNPEISATMPAEDLDEVISQYDGEIRWVDDNIGRILEKLDDLNLRNRTLLILTSDHGEEFFEHGDKGHGKTLYDEIVRIPLVFAGPGVEEDQVIDHLQAGIIDIYPTILALLDLAPSGEALGRSLDDVLRDGRQSEDSPALSELLYRREGGGEGLLQSLRSLRHKVIADLDTDHLEVFDLIRDPGELAPLPASEESDRIREDLKGRLAETAAGLRRHEQGLSKSIDRTVGDQDEEIKRRLRALGYLEE